MNEIYRSQFRLPYSLYEQLKQASEESQRSVNAELISRLQESFATPPRTPDASDDIVHIRHLESPGNPPIAVSKQLLGANAFSSESLAYYVHKGSPKDFLFFAGDIVLINTALGLKDKAKGLFESKGMKFIQDIEQTKEGFDAVTALPKYERTPLQGPGAPKLLGIVIYLFGPR